MNLDIVSKLSSGLGISEEALKIVFSLLINYPIALVFRKYLYNKDERLKHVFFATAGLILGLWNFGLASLNCVFAVVFTFLTLVFLRGSAACVALTFVFNMSYLLIGYAYSATENYDINWTVPQCILTLRLIGVAYDLYDGHQPSESLSAENKKVALIKRPSLLEMLGHSMFPGGFIVGPQFPMKRYQDFIRGDFIDRDNTGKAPKSSIKPAVIRLFLGIGYIITFQLLGLWVTDDYLISEGFEQIHFLKRMLLLGLWGRYTLYKYISCWLLAEGSCILYGLTHNGLNREGKAQWNALANVDLIRLETATEFNHYILSFNINTNHWVAQYIYKRLKFLGNRHVSQAASLLFLALWHGFHTGYYVCFLCEFLVIYMERDIQNYVKRNPTLQGLLNNEEMKLFTYIVLRIYTFVFMGWCLLPFALLTFERYWVAFRAVNYAGIALFGIYPLVWGPLLRLTIPKGTVKEN